MPANPFSSLIVVPPPAIYAVAFLAGIAADKVHPWRPDWMLAQSWIGWLLIGLGVILGPLNAAIFLLRRTTLNPVARPSALVTTGVYRISRNPMYLGLSAIYCGLAIVLARAWPLVFLPLPLLAMIKVVVPAEEKRMNEVFGAEFAAYCRKVRRWL
jgi:protein-S-isoprenylcysteine O-methyltransferase Ste14